MRSVAVLGLGAMLATLAACEPEETSSPETPPTARDELAQGLSVALCSELSPCCDARGLAEPAEGCRVAMRNAVMQAIIYQEDEQRELIEDRVPACVTTFREAMSAHGDCRTLPTPNDLATICPEVFTPMPEGTLAPGAACTLTHQCQSPPEGSRSCASEDGISAFCVWRVEVGVGELCAKQGGVEPVCPAGYFCGMAPDQALRCREPALPGEYCEADENCPEGYGCAGPPDARACALRVGPLAPCAPFDSCAEDHYCDGLSETCQPFPDPCADGGCDTIVFENACR